MYINCVFEGIYINKGVNKRVATKKLNEKVRPLISITIKKAYINKGELSKGE